jgi:hypothetical protein
VVGARRVDADEDCAALAQLGERLLALIARDPVSVAKLDHDRLELGEDDVELAQLVAPRREAGRQLEQEPAELPCVCERRERLLRPARRSPLKFGIPQDVAAVVELACLAEVRGQVVRLGRLVEG